MENTQTSEPVTLDATVVVEVRGTTVIDNTGIFVNNEDDRQCSVGVAAMNAMVVL